MREKMIQRLRTPALLLALLALVDLPLTGHAAPAVGCLIEPENVADLGSPVIGIVDQINADRGDTVKKGQVLAVLRSDVERAATDVARSRAQANAELQAALSNRNFAQQKYRRSRDLAARDFISAHALDESANELKVAEQRVVQAQQQLRVWENELGMAEAQLGLRRLKSPFDGVVVERYLSLGERMEEKPIFRIAQIDPLRVEVIVPSSLFGTIKVGATASVLPGLPSATPINATITLVDRVVDAASNTFRVRLQLPNPGHTLPSGLRCKVEFANGGANSGTPAAGKGNDGADADISLRLSNGLPSTPPATAGKATTAH